MISSNPTLIFVHGGWHLADCFTNIITELEQDGYHCIAPQLQMCGTPEPVSSLVSTVNVIHYRVAHPTEPPAPPGPY
ncbi:alpha/beta-hydrolase [Penicillium lagena]|uniref:alpha/beta-hydrolase n=1 Tax=Penicillium lagena TaxID=94218 RepID=UPI002540FCDF|nr:alpha/beta-hydrolase [Penicillium lagena]KAJ5619763.1 alpha/beta-hydrolase [Penicillium lagena]